MTLAHCRKKASFFDVSDSESDVSEKCAYGRRSPSDALERVRQVEVLGLATDGSERCERHNSDAKCVDMLMHANDKIVHQANIVLNAAILYICGMA